MGYQSKVLSGFSWQTGLKILLAGIAMVKVAVLARLLTPTDFGVFSLVTIAIGITEAATQTGVNYTLLKTRESVSYYVSTAWVIAIVRGFVIGLLMIALGVILQRIYDQPQLVYLIAVASLIPVIKGFINPAIVNLHKNFKFGADAAFRLSLYLIEAVASVVLVYVLQSILGWVVGMIIAAIAEVVISFLLFRTRPRFEYSPARGSVILGQAKSLALSSVLGYLNENVDNMLVGRIAGTYALGLYQPSYSLTHEPTYEVAKSLHHGALPAMTRMATDKVRLRRAFFKSLLGVIAITTVLSLPLLIAPGFFIPLVLGAKWNEAIELIRWLVIAGLVQAVIMVGHTLFLSRGALRAMNFHQLLSFVAMVAGIAILGSQQGAYGAVVGLALSRISTLPVLGWLVWRELKCRRE